LILGLLALKWGYANDVTGKCLAPDISVTASVWAVRAAADLPAVLGIGVLRFCFRSLGRCNADAAIAILGVAPHLTALAASEGSPGCDRKREGKYDCKYSTV
jgi:hypothetical protein